LDEFAQEIQHGAIGPVLEGGQSEVGIESSILDLTRLVSHGPVLLRPGHISAQAIEQVLGVPVQFANTGADSSAPRASGTLDAHYAPNTPVITVASELFESTKTQLLAQKKHVATMYFSVPHSTIDLQKTFDLQMPKDVFGYAHRLYAALRQLDTVGAELILVEAPPMTAEWQGVNDRLSRAAFDSRFLLAQLLVANKV